MQRVLFDTLVSQMLKMMLTLNLEFRLINEDDVEQVASLADESSSGTSNTERTLGSLSCAQNDLSERFRPLKPRDFELYLNFVELFRLFLFADESNSQAVDASNFRAETIRKYTGPQNTKFTLRQWFSCWIIIFAREMITLSSRHPLVSGFYKMMSVLMGICEEQEYFKEIQSSILAGRSADSAEEGEDIGNKLYLYSTVSKFIQEVVVRIRQFTQELLFAAISMVLTVPIQFVDFPVFLPALNQCLKIGLTFNPAALLAMDALERWDILIPHAVKVNLPRILPSLAAYIRPVTALRPGSAVMGDGKEGGELGNLEVSVAQVSLGVESVASDDSVKVVTRILGFLGKMGGENRHILNASKVELSLAWDYDQHIKYALPFPSYKLDVFLDPLLPRITYLAEHCSDRKTKVGDA